MKYLIPLALAVFTTTAWGQRQVQPEDLQGLSRTDRETIHPGDPLDIVGIDEGDNAFRTASPALAQGELAVTLVDPEELRARRLAMYSNQARFNTPPASSSRRTGETLTRELPDFLADRANLAPETDPEGSQEGSTLPYWVGGVVLVGAFVVLRQRS